MKVLVVGSGGREHAIADAVVRSPRCTGLYVAPGNAGTPGQHLAVAADDVPGLVAAARDHSIDVVIVGPEVALAAGLVDALGAAGVRAFGPTQAAARLESSKGWARAFCERHGIAGPRSVSVVSRQAAAAWLDAQGLDHAVVKADGLAAGKGVVVADDRDATLAAVDAALGGAFGAAGHEVVLEERLEGEEVSLLAFSDGTSVVAMPPAQDHKRIGEGDRGPNTGGMGAYAPAPVCPPELAADLTRTVLQPAVAGMAAEGHAYVGVLYAGLMLTAAGPRVLEFNCRFGDPETQVLLPLLATDLLDVVDACLNGRLGDLPVAWHDGAALTVVLAADGYPEAPVAGGVLAGLDDAAAVPGATVYHAGTRSLGDAVVATGGRVLAVTGVGADVHVARERAYEALRSIVLPGGRFRRDIGWRALARQAAAGGYAASGVDIDAGNDAVARMKEAVERTHGPAVLRGVGAFGGVFDAGVLRAYDHPVLVASTDGVGTKVELLARAGRPGVAGTDIVNHCIDDVLVQRARPLFFLDYIATSKLDPAMAAAVVTGMARACEAAGCALLGGETAEMPGVYTPGAFDIAGTLVGVGERDQLLPRTDLAPGDVLIGLASSGPHTNGYSLLRRVFAGLPLDAQPEPLEVPLVDALCAPHRSYLDVLWPLLQTDVVKALVHITGGGLVENPPRILPAGLAIEVQLGSWPVPPLFRLVRDITGLDARELHRTLNMGIGMVLVVAPDDVSSVQSKLSEESWVIGRIVPGDRQVRLLEVAPR